MTGLFGADLDRVCLFDAFDCYRAALDEERMLRRATSIMAAMWAPKDAGPSEVDPWAWGKPAQKGFGTGRPLEVDMRLLRGRSVARQMRQFGLSEEEARVKLSRLHPAIGRGEYILPTN